jgi:probable rRNA maturation factor
MNREMPPDRALTLLNRQRTRPVNLRLLRRILEAFLLSPQNACLQAYDLALCLVAAPEMIRLNETHLRHKGSTDVITFDYADSARPDFLHGEIFICVDEALIQARRFRTTWQSELVRYAVHGILHLRRYDDQTTRARYKMKKIENKSMAELGRQFAFSKLTQRPVRK